MTNQPARLLARLTRLLAAALALPACAAAATYSATPATYRSVLTTLRAGDTLNLAAGTYPPLQIAGLRGTAAAWITVQGPTSGMPAAITGQSGYNTVELTNVSYLALKNLRIDSRGIDGLFGLSAKGGTPNLTHNVLVSNCTFVGQGGSQQTVAISTKTPTWGWTIRGNVIQGAGTGLYLGNSDGTMPFVGGLIEGNLIQNTIGYGGQIKWQRTRPAVPGMPAGPSRTVVRHNVFIKSDAACGPDGCRPNFLVDGFPDSGPGSSDLYEIYGNFFYNNPYELLLQASGRVSVHDNIFVNKAAGQTAVLLRDHDLPLKLAHVYDNTVYAAGSGINMASVPRQGQTIAGNLVFAQQPLARYAAGAPGNLSASLASAGSYVTQPSTVLGSMDFSPLAGKASGGSLDISAFAGDVGRDYDFNGQSRGSFTVRGAYAGASQGWRLQAGRKPLPGT